MITTIIVPSRVRRSSSVAAVSALPDLDTVMRFAAVSFAIVIVPGPSVLFVVGQGISHGRRAAFSTVLGNTVGAYCQILLVAFGLGAVVARSAEAYHALRVAGALYLIWLGVQTIRGDDESEASRPAVPARSHARDGFVVGITNPKLLAFLAAMLPQFVPATAAHPAAEMAALGAVFAAVAFVCDSAWGLAAGSARDWFRQAPRRQRVMQVTGGGVMIGLGVRLLADPRR